MQEDGNVVLVHSPRDYKSINCRGLGCLKESGEGLATRQTWVVSWNISREERDRGKRAGGFVSGTKLCSSRFCSSQYLEEAIMLVSEAAILHFTLD